jgi:hypothetical protein
MPNEVSCKLISKAYIERRGKAPHIPNPNILNKLIQAVTFPTFIWDLVRISAGTPTIKTEIIRGVSESLHSN